MAMKELKIVKEFLMFNNVHGYCAICGLNLDHVGCYYVLAYGRFHLCEGCVDSFYADPDHYPDLVRLFPYDMKIRKEL